MDTRTFLDNFGTIAEAPGGVDRLRDVVRDLAIRGNLGTGDDADEPAPSLLKRTANARDALIATGCLRTRALSVDRTLQCPFLLPERWAWSFLADSLVWDLTDGDWVESKDQDPDGEVRLIQLADVGVGDFKDKSARFLTRATAARLNCTYLSPGDVLIARLPSPLGRSCVFPGTSQPAVTVVDVAIARGGAAGMEPTYLALAMNSPTMRELSAALATGTTRQRVSTGNLRKLTIPVPPLAEQQRIVIKVDELMQLCDDLEARQQACHHVSSRLRASSFHALTAAETSHGIRTAWSRIRTNWQAFTDHPDNIDALRQTIFQLAVRGKLVTQDVDEGLAINLIERIELERQRLGLRSGMTLDAKPRFQVPETWTWTTFGFVTDARLGKMLDQAKNTGKYRPYLRNTNVQWFRFELDDIAELRLEDNEYREYELRVGDLLICEGGEPGRAAVCDDTVAGLVFQKALHRARPLLGIEPRYLAFLLRSYAGSGLLSSYFTGATIQHFTGRSLARLPVPLPPVGEQRRIVDRVRDLMILCDSVEVGLALRSSHHEQLGRATTSLLASRASPPSGA